MTAAFKNHTRQIGNAVLDTRAGALLERFVAQMAAAAAAAASFKKNLELPGREKDKRRRRRGLFRRGLSVF